MRTFKVSTSVVEGGITEVKGFEARVVESGALIIYDMDEEFYNKWAVAVFAPGTWDGVTSTVPNKDQITSLTFEFGGGN